VITIQSAMLVALGFFTAGLIGFLLAPFYGRRSARIATDELRATMPLSSTEIAADKDRLRATYALTIHKLEQKVEKAAFSAARQRVELNRRDAAISELEGEAERLRTLLEEHENARRVLEQTIAERMPKVEFRLGEAKSLLQRRDNEITNLTQASRRQSQALEEATQINAQQRDELHRLKATMAARAARNRETLSDPRFDGEVALRAEIEALRAKTRDQSALISRLQGTLSNAGARPDQIQDGVLKEAPAETPVRGARDTAGSGVDLTAEINRLRKDLVDAENALRSARGMAEAGHAGQTALEAEIRTLKATGEDQAAEIAKLKAALATYEAEDADDRALKESKVAMRARLSALQAQADEHASTIQRLRAEIATANEKLARQAAHFMEEMRRLGVGTVKTTGARHEPAERPTERAKTPLVERIAAPRPSRPAQSATAAPAQGGRETRDSARVSGFLRALDGAAATTVRESQTGSGQNGGTASGTAADGEAPAKKTDRRASLIERITRAEKPVA